MNNTHVTVFSGGHGGATILQGLNSRPNTEIAVIINGYDDGLSTGLVRRAFPQMLGPSDFRKVAYALGEQVSLHLNDRYAMAEALDLFRPNSNWEPIINRIEEQASIEGYRGELATGNLVFTGMFLQNGGNFQAAVDEYAKFCGVPSKFRLIAASEEPGILAARTLEGGMLGSESAMTNSSWPIHSVFIVPSCPPNLLAVQELKKTNLVILAPGTFHSSLIPSLLILRWVLRELEVPVVWVANLARDNGMQGWAYQEALEQISRAGTDVTHIIMDRKSELCDFLTDEETVEITPRVFLGDFSDGGKRHIGERVIDRLEREGLL